MHLSGADTENNYLFSSTHEVFIIKYIQLCLFTAAEIPMNSLINIVEKCHLLTFQLILGRLLSFKK